MEAKTVAKFVAAAWAAAVAANELRLRTRQSGQPQPGSNPRTGHAKQDSIVIEASSGPVHEDELGRLGVARKAFKLGAWLDMVSDSNSGYSVMLQQGAIHVYGPKADDLANAKPYVFPIGPMPKGQWLPLSYHGKKMPLAVKVQPNGIYCQWLPVPVVSPESSSSAPHPSSGEAQQRAADSKEVYRAATGGLAEHRRVRYS
jgi:hypothetical protein